MKPSFRTVWLKVAGSGLHFLEYLLLLLRMYIAQVLSHPLPLPLDPLLPVALANPDIGPDVLTREPALNVLSCSKLASPLNKKATVAEGRPIRAPYKRVRLLFSAVHSIS